VANVVKMCKILFQKCAKLPQFCPSKAGNSRVAVPTFVGVKGDSGTSGHQ